MTKSQIPNLKSRMEWGALALILLAAIFMRLYRLDSVPPGLTHDEADVGHFALDVLRGVHETIDSPQGYIHEPFVHYSGAAFMLVLGPSDFALRVHAAFWGLMLVLFTYAWARQTFDRGTGLLAAALVAVSYWTVSTSRQAHNFIPVPALFAAGAYFLGKALFGTKQASHLRDAFTWIAGIVCFAAALYSYESSRTAMLALPAFWLYLGITRKVERRRWVEFALALAAILALAASHLLDPAAWGRTNTLAEPLRAAQSGDWKPLTQSILSGLGTLTFRGDSLVTYNLPGRPILDPVTGILFYIGLALCFWRALKGQSSGALALLWFVCGIAPTLVVGSFTSTLHSSAAQAVVYTLPALTFVAIVRRWPWAAQNALRAGLIAAAGLILTGAITFKDYFEVWGQSPATRAAYFYNLSQITDFMNHTPYSGVTALSSPFPDLPLDPFIADLRLHRRDLALRWFDARRAIVFPHATRSLLIVPANTPLDPHLAGQLDLAPIERFNLRSDDATPYFDVAEWNPDAALAHFTASPARQVIVGDKQLDLPISFGAVQLVAYDVPTPTVTSGGTVTLLTVWRVLDPAALGPKPAHDYGRAAAIFVHLLDAKDAVVGQEDRLDAPAWNWQPGDAFAQVHQFQVAPDTQAGSLRLEVGLYIRQTLARLPVLVNGVIVDDRVILPVEITSP